jgi:hypothetical protein
LIPDGDEQFEEGERYIYDGENLYFVSNPGNQLIDRYLNGLEQDQLLASGI